MPADAGLPNRFSDMSEDELAAVDLAALDPAGQDALLRETSRRARDQETQESRRADIAYWKKRGYLIRWAGFAILVGALAVAYGLMN